jgi:hypothetical protein
MLFTSAKVAQTPQNTNVLIIRTAAFGKIYRLQVRTRILDAADVVFGGPAACEGLAQFFAIDGV